MDNAPLEAPAPQDAPSHPAIKAHFTPEQARDCTQMLIISAAEFGRNDVTVTARELIDGTWTDVIGPMAGWIGPAGMTTDPGELDWFTPVGVYSITNMFGRLADPGCKFRYDRCLGQEYWVDDIYSPLYNTWQVVEDGQLKDWDSAERLKMYPYAFAFDFNQNPIVFDGNSAIFFHEGTSPTAGCIAVAQRKVIEIMCWLDPIKSPKVVLGVQVAPSADLIDQARERTIDPDVITIENRPERPAVPVLSWKQYSAQADEIFEALTLFSL